MLVTHTYRAHAERMCSACRRQVAPVLLFYELCGEGAYDFVDTFDPQNGGQDPVRYEHSIERSMECFDGTFDGPVGGICSARIDGVQCRLEGGSGLYSYDLYSYGLYSHGLYSYGL